LRKAAPRSDAAETDVAALDPTHRAVTKMN